MANVSIGTVDRVLHGRGKVSPEADRKIQDIIKKYHYTPNKAARSLSYKDPKRLGIIYPRCPEYFWDQARKGMEDVLNEIRDMGMEAEFGIIDGSLNENDVLKWLNYFEKKDIDGIALVPLRTEEIKSYLKRYKNKSKKVVTFNNDIDEPELRDVFVGSNSYRLGMRAAGMMAHFMSCKGNILIIRERNQLFYELMQRIDGFEENIRMNYPNVKIVSKIELNMDSWGDSEKDIKRLTSILKSGSINAVFDAVGSSLMNVIELVEKLGIKENLILAGFELNDLVVRKMAGGAVDLIINQDVYSQGANVVRSMFNMLVDGLEPVTDTIYTRADFIIREDVL